MEKTEGMPPLNHDFSAVASELIAANLARKELEKELAEERVKTEALSRRCVKLGQELEECQEREHNREDADIIGFVNDRCTHNEAMKQIHRQNKRNAKKAAAAYEEACTKNAFTLFLSFVGVIGSVLFGAAGFINGTFALVIACTALIAFGWSLNDCVHLLRRCPK